MAIFIENLNGFGANTDIGAVGSFVRNTGTVGSAIVNADGFFDIVSVTPNSKVSYPVALLDNSMECTTAQASIGGNYYPIGVSVTSGGNGIYARITGSNFIELAKIVSDVITPLVGSGGTIINATYATGTRTTGDRLKVQRIGDTVKVFFNDVEKFSVDVSAQGVARTTNTGMYIRSTTGTDLFTQFTMEGIAAYAITTVNSGNPVKIGSTVSFTKTGFTKAITKGTLDGVALAAATDTTITVPNLVDGAQLPRKGLSRTLFLSSADDTETATINIEVANPDGWASTVIESGFSTGELDSIDYNFSPPLAVDDIIFYDPLKGTAFPDAGYEGDYEGTQTLWHHDESTKTVYSFPLLTGLSGASQPITLDPWRLNPATSKYEAGYEGIPVGQLLVVGSGFGTKSFNEPITWETFNGTNGQLLSAYNADWVPFNGDGALITNINPRFSGHKSAYNDPTRNPDPEAHSQFWTNSKTSLARASRTRFASYWVRVNHRADVEDGQIKFTRISSSAASGGGGVYSGAGAHLLNAPTTDSWQLGWYSLTPDARNKYLDSAWYPTNRWVRIEYEIYLSDLDTPNGIYNAHVIGYGSKTFSGVMQRETGYGATLLLDSILLGLETANPETWVTPNVLTPSTTYTVTVVKSGTTYVGTYTSGGSTPTAAQIIDGIEASILVAGLSPADIRTNPANTGEIGFWWNTTVTYTSNMSRATPISVQQGETYEDDDFKRFYVGNADTWAACTESHPQPYTAWSDTHVQLIKYVGGISGRTWLYKQLTPNTTPVRVGEVVGDEIIYG